MSRAELAAKLRAERLAADTAFYYSGEAGPATEYAAAVAAVDALVEEVGR